MDAILKRILSDQDRRHGEIIENLEVLKDGTVGLANAVRDLVAIVKAGYASQEQEPQHRRPPGRRCGGEKP